MSIASTGVVQQLTSKGLPWLRRSVDNAYAPTATWILGTAGMVVGMIHVGGVTRLTQSGLSMTTWTPLGGLPPQTHQAWLEEFERYKKFPEWEQRKSMTLNEFKYIYAWEYGHRMMGRAVGVIFTVPWLYFTLRGGIPSGYQGRMVLLGSMGAGQGLVGWWMVKSGLGDDRRGDKQQIRVRPQRLATHLGMAMLTYATLFWTAMQIYTLPHHHSNKTSSWMTDLIKAAQNNGSVKEALRRAARLQTGGMIVSGLTVVTILSGALVAGNDAGRAYNTFPTMNGEWIPSEIWDATRATATTSTSTPYHRLAVENTAMVQWNHRVLATLTALSATSVTALGYMWSSARVAAPNVSLSSTSTLSQRILLTPQARWGLAALGVTTAGQYALGVTALLSYVPITLAAAHQLGSVAVLTSSLYLVHALRYARPALQRAVAAATTSTMTTGTAGAPTVPAAAAAAAATTRAWSSPVTSSKGVTEVARGLRTVAFKNSK